MLERVVSTAPATPSGYCAICQKASADIVCFCCREQWDIEASWVQDLVWLERRWRRSNRRQRELAPLHISVDGQLRRKDKRLSIRYLSRQKCQLTRVENRRAVEDIKLWVAMGGLTPHERSVYHLMIAGIPDEANGSILAEIERRHVTKSAYLRYRKRVVQKIHDAMQSE